MKSHSVPQKSPFTLKVNCKAKMKTQFCPISALNALHNQAAGEVSTMEIIFNDFSRKRNKPPFCTSRSLPAHWALNVAPPLAACGTEPRKGLTKQQKKCVSFKLLLNITGLIRREM